MPIMLHLTVFKKIFLSEYWKRYFCIFPFKIKPLFSSLFLFNNLRHWTCHKKSGLLSKHWFKTPHFSSRSHVLVVRVVACRATWSIPAVSNCYFFLLGYEVVKKRADLKLFSVSAFRWTENTVAVLLGQ